MLVSGSRASRAQGLAILAGAGAMFLLHLGDHGALIVTLVGVGVYAAVNVALWVIPRHRSALMEERRRLNFDADIEDRRRRRDGGGLL